jgi:carbamate kinase
MKTMLIAVGGNSLIRAGEKGTVAEQRANARRTAVAIVNLIRRDYRLVITHGNGPQVGAALLRSERTSDQVPPHTLASAAPLHKARSDTCWRRLCTMSSQSLESTYP